MARLRLEIDLQKVSESFTNLLISFWFSSTVAAPLLPLCPRWLPVLLAVCLRRLSRVW